VDVDEPPVLEHRLAGRSALVRWGVRAWLLVGVLLAAAAVAWLLGQLSGLVVPLVLAAVLGALLAPVVDRLERHRVPRIGGATAVLLGLGAVVAGSVWLVVAGVVEQAPQISAQLRAGFESLSGWLESHGIDIAAGPGVDALRVGQLMTSIILLSICAAIVR